MSGAAKATGGATGEETVEAGPRLYLIGPAGSEPERFAAALDQALSERGVAAFLLRNASVEHGFATALRQVCAGRAAFLVEDDTALALGLDADGVHLSDPGRVRDARARLGADRILGAACGYSRHTAMLAGDDGADYIAFGEAVRGPEPPLLELIAWWNELFVLPCLALGAFDGASSAAVARAGADFIGLSDAVWRHPGGAAAGVRSIQDAIAGA